MCELLSSTGVLGKPREYFNASARRKFDDPAYPDEPSKQFDQILTTGATPNEIYGLKVFPKQHDAIAKTCAWTKLLPNLKFVFLERRDSLGQALSLLRVQQTGKFRDSLPAKSVETYDGQMIHKYLYGVVATRARWMLYFARTGIEPLRVYYEDVSANPQREIDRIAAFIGSCGPAIVKPELVEVRV